MRIGMHRDVAGDVVKNIWFGQIVELVGTANGDGGGEFALAQAIEELESRHIAADSFGAKTGEWMQKAIYIL